MLRSQFHLVLAFTAVITLSGCYEIRKIFNQGTVKGVTLCVENNNSPLLSDELIKRNCISEHQTTFQSDNTVSARASLSINLAHDYMDVDISQGSSGYDNIIITEIHVTAYVYGSNGKKYSNTGIIYVWLEPHLELKGSVRIKDFGFNDRGLSFNDRGLIFNKALNNFCSSRGAKVSCKSWYISRYRGVKI